MKTSIILALFFVFLIQQDLKAQQENVLPIGATVSREQNQENNTLEVLSLAKSTSISAQGITNPDLNNRIKINQIGDYNNAQVYLKAFHSNLTMNQFGDNNDINFYKSASEVKQTIQQVGNSNFVSDYSPYSNYKVDMQINQQGNNLSIFNNGTNSISKEMKITQSGNSGTIYIYNR
jgi:hypothetical protein